MNITDVDNAVRSLKGEVTVVTKNNRFTITVRFGPFRNMGGAMLMGDECDLLHDAVQSFLDMWNSEGKEHVSRVKSFNDSPEAASLI